MTDPIGNATSNTRTVSRAEQMELLDRLPDELKKIVWNAPTPIDVRDVVRIVQMLGEPVARDFIRAQLDKKFPGWRQEETLPKRPSQTLSRRQRALLLP